MSIASTPMRKGLRMKQSVTAMTVVVMSILYAIFCQAQILGTGQLSAPRRSHTATLLQNGKILIVGGDNASGLVGQAELFDPVSLTSSNIAANPIALRTDHTATLLADGRILIIGGVDSNGLLASSEFYNPNSVPAPSFTAGPTLMRGRSGHTATMLSDGKILIAGGESTGSAEIYDPATQRFSLASGSLNMPRQYHSAALLSSGKVFIAGGVVGANTTLTSAEIYDPQTQTFTPASGAMQTPRGLALLRVLPDGKVQVIGGDGEFSMEMFDPAINSFIALAHIPPHEDYLNNIIASRTRSALITTIIQQNPVLQGQPELTAEIIALLNRLDHTVTEIPQSNRALIAGGVDDAGQILNSATMVSSSAAMITTDKLDYAPGEIVTITGSGFQPDETVWMLFHEEPETHPDVVISSIADSQGKYTNTDYAPALNDLNRNFTLTAIGQASGATAQTAFKDAITLDSVTVGAQSGTITFGTVGSASYPICVAYHGSNSTIAFSVISGLPSGVTPNFSANNINNPVKCPTTATTLTLTTTASVSAGTYTFTVQASGGGTMTSTGTLVVSKANSTATLTGTGSFTYDALAHAATANVTGAGGLNQSVPVVYSGNCSAAPINVAETPCTVTATFAGDANRNGSSATGTITITKRSATWTTNAASKTYGDADPSPLTTGASAASPNNFLATDNVTATYGRVAGESASPPTYRITATLSAAAGVLANYTITNNGAEFTINKRNATWTTNPNSKNYGDADPSPLTTGASAASPNNFLAADGVTATYARVAGDTVAESPYHITATLSATVAGALNNYNITNAGADFTINKRNASVTATDGSKIYGDADPTLATTNSGFLGADLGAAKITFSASRAAGENVGTYAITPSASDNGTGLLNNYNVTYNNGTFTINKRPITITADAKSKIYGDADPALTYQIASGSLKSGDSITGALTRAAGENVGTYAITQGTVAISDGNNGNNYDLSFVGALLTINKRPITITADPKSKIYGDTDSALAYQFTAGSLKSGDSIIGTLTRAAGENAGTYAISQGTLTISDGNSGNNYNLTFAGANLTINKKDVSVTPNAASKIYGDADSTLTGTLSGFLASDNVTAIYSRTAGESVGSYTISATLTPAGVLGNYNITYNTTPFTIDQRLASVTPNAASKTYGDTDPALIGTLSGFLPVDGVAASYSRATGETVGSYTISATLSPDGVLSNYNITYNTAVFTINKADPIIAATGNSCTYDGNPCAGSGSATGVHGESLTPVTVAYKDALNNLLTSAPVAAGTYSVAARYAGDANYNQKQSTPATITINKAGSSTVVTVADATYDGNPHGGSAAVTGIGGLNQALAVFYQGQGSTIYPSATAAPTSAGTYSASATFPGDANHDGSSDVRNFVINKAAASIILSGATTYIYDGNQKFASADTNPSSLSGLTITYSGSTTAPTNPGSYVVIASLNNANYQAADATGTLVIIARPIAYDQSVSTNEDNTTLITLGATDIDSPSLTFSIVNGPSHGSLSGTPPNVSYTASSNYNGADSFSFKATDGDMLDSNVATVSIAVTAVNDKPQAQAQNVATDEDVPVVITLRGRDIDSAALNFSIATGPSHGSLSPIDAPVCTQVPNPSATQGVSCSATVTYTPTPDYNGPDSFTFITNDGNLDSLAVSVVLTVNPVNDTPTANAQSVIADDMTPLPIALTGSDVETAATQLTFAIVTAPAHGNLSGIAPNLIYTANSNYKGPDSFTFMVTDRGDPDNCGVANQSCADVKTSPEATVSITVTDGTAPNTLLTTTVPATLSNDRNPTFGFTGTDNVTADANLAFECSLNYGPFSACGSPGDFTTSFSALVDGSHTFQVRAKDQSGNADVTPASYTWTIDATAPDTLIDSQPPALASSATASFTFHSIENNSTLACSLDGAPAVNCTGGSKSYLALSDGQHTFTVAATDQAGNVDTTPATVVWTVDTTAPQTSINNQPANPTTSTSASFSFSGSDPAGQDTFECSLDGAAFAACGSPKTYNGLALGNHSFTVRSKDSAGNMDATPASYNWTIGTVTVDNYTMDTEFKRFDGFDVVFGKGTGSYSKINSTNPDSFHYQIKLTNNTGMPISPSNGNMATAIITVPGMPSSCGGVSCSSQIGSLSDPAFVLRGRKVAHVWPGYHDRDDDDDDDDMPVTVKYMTLAQYQANSNSCADNPNYSSTLPSNGAPKCIKITSFSIPVKHAARIRLNFQFRLKGTDGWDANSQKLFYAGFVFRATTSVNFGSNVQTATDSAGLVGAGNKAAAIGGYAFTNVGSPLSGYAVRVFNKASEASCSVNTKLVSQDVIDANGFYYIWRTGTDQHIVAPNLPAGMQYAVQLCNGSTQLGLQTIDSRLREKEFEQVDFHP